MKGKIEIENRDDISISKIKNGIYERLQSEGFDVNFLGNEVYYEGGNIFSLTLKNWFPSRTGKGIYHIDGKEKYFSIEYDLSTTRLLKWSFILSAGLSISHLLASDTAIFESIIYFIFFSIFFSLPNFLILKGVNNKFLSSFGDSK